MANEVNKNSEFNFDPLKKYGGVGSGINLDKDCLVVLQHPVTNEYSESLNQIKKTLKVIYDLNIQTFWFWPNVDAGSDGTSKGIRTFREEFNPKNIHFFKNMEPNDFLRLLINSSCLIGNSSVGIRECSFLGVPVVNIGSRQNRRARGFNVVDVKNDERMIKDAILKQFNSKKEKSQIYGTGNSGKKIAELLSTLPLKFHKTINY